MVDTKSRTCRYDGDTRLVSLAVHLSHGETFNIVSARGEQADDASQHARFVVYNSSQCASYDHVSGMIIDEIGALRGGSACRVAHVLCPVQASAGSDCSERIASSDNQCDAFKCRVASE